MSAVPLNLSNRSSIDVVLESRNYERRRMWEIACGGAMYNNIEGLTYILENWELDWMLHSNNGCDFIGLMKDAVRQDALSALLVLIEYYKKNGDPLQKRAPW